MSKTDTIEKGYVDVEGRYHKVMTWPEIWLHLTHHTVQDHTFNALRGMFQQVQLLQKDVRKLRRTVYILENEKKNQSQNKSADTNPTQTKTSKGKRNGRNR